MKDFLQKNDPKGRLQSKFHQESEKLEQLWKTLQKSRRRAEKGESSARTVECKK